MNSSEIKEAALAQLEVIAHALIPGFRRSGNCLVAGNIAGEPGSSLKLNLSGRSAGLWRDWAANDGRSKSIVDLVMEVKGLKYSEAMKWLSEFTGVPIRQSEKAKQHKYTPPPLEKTIELKPESRVGQWIASRKIPIEIAKIYGVCGNERDNAAIMLHYNGMECCMVKAFWHPDEAKESKCYSSKDPLHVLFGMNIVTVDTATTLPAGSLLITEGQWDAMSYASIGVPAVSIPSGVDNLQWIDNCWEYLMQFTTFYLSFDMDDPGRKCAQLVAGRLGFEKCRNVILPEKDANDMLKADRVAEMKISIEEAPEFTPDFITQANTYKEEVRDIIHSNMSMTGLPFIWNDFPLRIRQGQYTVYTGFAGHGKSTLVQQLMAFFISLGERSCIASIEATPAETISIMLKQVAGDVDLKNQNVFDRLYSSLNDYIDIYDNKNEKADVDRMVELFTYAYQRHGVTQFVVDNVMCLSVARSDLDGQSYAVDKFRAFCRRLPVHLHVVAHPRKPPSSQNGGHPAPPALHEIRGASEWGDMAWNVVTMWRNKAKDDNIRNAIEQNADPTAIQYIKANEPDGKIIVHKQRATGVLPVMDVWHDPKTKRFMEAFDIQNKPYL